METANRWFDKLQLVVSANGEVRDDVLGYRSIHCVIGACKR